MTSSISERRNDFVLFCGLCLFNPVQFIVNIYSQMFVILACVHADPQGSLVSCTCRVYWGLPACHKILDRSGASTCITLSLSPRRAGWMVLIALKNSNSYHVGWLVQGGINSVQQADDGIIHSWPGPICKLKGFQEWLDNGQELFQDKPLIMAWEVKATGL